MQSGVPHPSPHSPPPMFTPFKLRDMVLRNRVVVSPMCQYFADDGLPNDWHLVHLGSRAVGGAGLVMVEASGVSPAGRITAWDSGIWSQQHADAFRRIAAFIESNGAVAGIQLAHAGRKASTDVPWRGGRVIGDGPNSWQTVAPSPIPFRDGEPVPHELTSGEIDEIVEQFVRSTELALQAGFRVVELHMAHGYLLHEFLSPLSNVRTDEFGGGFDNRVRFTLEVTEAVRGAWPRELPLFLRISATDWAPGGWTVDDSVALAKLVDGMGVDLI